VPVQNPIHILRKGQGLVPWSPTKVIHPGKRVFLVENQRKANQIGLIFPEDEVISLGKFPLTQALSIPDKPKEKLHYRIILHPEHGKCLMAAIHKKCAGKEALVILTERNTRGEALACGIAEHLENPENLPPGVEIFRVHTRSLHRSDLIQSVEEELQKSPNLRRKPNAAKAASYWVKATMDITWKKKISSWVEEATKLVKRYHKTPAAGQGLESLTRLQCALLHTLHKRESQNRPPHQYWEVQTLLMGSLPGTILQASIAVPNLLQLSANEETSMTRRIWEDKLEESRWAAQNGLALPQKPPGNPWRFDNENEASLYRYHLRRYPLMTVESINYTQETPEPEAPHTTGSLLEASYRRGWGTQKETSTALEELYLAGLITHHKTGSPNLSDACFASLQKHARNSARPILATKRLFPQGGVDSFDHFPSQEISEKTRQDEQGAIAPALWERTPKVAQETIRRCLKPSLIELAQKLYQEIYDRARRSQEEPQKKRFIQITATGPLPITAEDAFRGDVSSKENLFKSLMNVILTGREEIPEGQASPLESLKSGNLLHAVKVQLHEKTSETPPQFSREELLLELQKDQLGKVETLAALLPKLEAAGLLEETQGIIRLTPAGRTTISLLTEYLGNFIHVRYHEIVHGQLQKIEQGKLNPEAFLQYWWTSLEEVAGKLPPIKEAVADSTGQTLAELEKALAQSNPKGFEPPDVVLFEKFA
jgi:DNA topoisomerase IA